MGRARGGIALWWGRTWVCRSLGGVSTGARTKGRESPGVERLVVRAWGCMRELGCGFTCSKMFGNVCYRRLTSERDSIGKGERCSVSVSLGLV